MLIYGFFQLINDKKKHKKTSKYAQSGDVISLLLNHENP